MQTKFLLLALSIATFSSCSTAYKSGQTPDDVYYSPTRIVEDNVQRQENKKENEQENRNKDYEIVMNTRDYRWRDFDEDYRYEYSPYSYCHCNCSNQGYYYNPYYHTWPVYTPVIVKNTTPRMVNLNGYTGFNNSINNVNSKTNTNEVKWIAPSRQYNNSNTTNSRTRVNLNRVVRTITGSSSNNDNRTYTPSSNNNNSSSSSSSSNRSSTNTRPARGN